MTIRKEIELYKNVARENPQSLIQKINTPGATTALEGMMIMTALSEVGRDANAFAAQNIPNPQPTILETISQSAPVNVASKSLEGEPSPQAAIREPRGSESTGVPGAISAFEGGLVAMKDGGTIYANKGKFFTGIKNKGLDFLMNLRKKQPELPGIPKAGLGSRVKDYMMSPATQNKALRFLSGLGPAGMGANLLTQLGRPSEVSASDVIMPVAPEDRPEELRDVPIDAGYLTKEVNKLIKSNDKEKLAQVKTILENEPNPSQELEVLRDKIDTILSTGEDIDKAGEIKFGDKDTTTPSTKRKETKEKTKEGLLAGDMEESLLSGDIGKKEQEQETKSDFRRKIEDSRQLYKDLAGDKEKFINMKKEKGLSFFKDYESTLDQKEKAVNDYLEKEDIRIKKLDEASQKRLNKTEKTLKDMKASNSLSEMRFLAFQLMGAKGPTLEALGNIGMNYQAFVDKNEEKLRKFENAKDDLEFELTRHDAEIKSANARQRMNLENKLSDAAMTYKQARVNFDAGIVDDLAKLDKEELDATFQLFTLKETTERTADQALFTKNLAVMKGDTAALKALQTGLNNDLKFLQKERENALVTGKGDASKYDSEIAEIRRKLKELNNTIAGQSQMNTILSTYLPKDI